MGAFDAADVMDRFADETKGNGDEVFSRADGIEMLRDLYVKFKDGTEAIVTVGDRSGTTSARPASRYFSLHPERKPHWIK